VLTGRRSLACSWQFLVEGLREKVSGMAGWIVGEFSEHSVAEALIEAEGLEAERVEPGGLASSASRCVFNRGHYLPAGPVSAQGVIYPEAVDMEPSPVCVAFGSGQDLTVNAEEHGQWLGPVWVDLRAVVGDESVRERLHVFTRGVVLDDEFDGVGGHAGLLVSTW
jgi:hypothetical protein